MIELGTRASEIMKRTVVYNCNLITLLTRKVRISRYIRDPGLCS